MFRAAIIGVTGFGDIHYRDLMREYGQGRMRPVAATIINPEEAAEKISRLRAAGCAIYADWREMLARHAGEIDICFIPTGIPLHAPMTIASLKAGANVFVEKPAAATVQEVRAMQTAEAETGRWVAVGYQSMYSPEMLIMKQAILHGDLGEVEAIKFYGLWPRDDDYYQRNSWAGRLRGADGAWILDSPYNNALAHQLNQIAFLAGATLKRSATPTAVRAELYRARNIASADTACIRCATQEGITLWCFVTHASQANEGPVLTVRGRGSISWTFQGTVVRRRDGSEQRLPSQRGLDGRDVRELIMDALCRKLAGDPDAFVCDLAIAKAQTIIVNGAHDSSPIRAAPREMVRREERSGKTWVIWHGIDDLIRRAAQEERMFHEYSAPWAAAGREVSVAGYVDGSISFPAPGSAAAE